MEEIKRKLSKRAREEVTLVPTLPTSFHSLKQLRAEIDLTGGESFLLQNEGSSDRILIFSTDAMFYLLCDLSDICYELFLSITNLPNSL